MPTFIPVNTPINAPDVYMMGRPYEGSTVRLLHHLMSYVRNNPWYNRPVKKLLFLTFRSTDQEVVEIFTALAEKDPTEVSTRLVEDNWTGVSINAGFKELYEEMEQFFEAFGYGIELASSLTTGDREWEDLAIDRFVRGPLEVLGLDTPPNLDPREAAVAAIMGRANVVISHMPSGREQSLDEAFAKWEAQSPEGHPIVNSLKNLKWGVGGIFKEALVEAKEEAYPERTYLYWKACGVNVITVKNYEKWYHLHYVTPEGKIVEVPSEIMDQALKEGHLWVDHYFSPSFVRCVARQLNAEIPETVMDMIVGRWVTSKLGVDYGQFPDDPDM